MIDGAKSFRAPVLGNKDGGFRRDFGVVTATSLWVEQHVALRGLGGFMPTDCFGSLSGVGIDEPEHHMQRDEFAFDPLHLRKVAI